MIPYLDYGALGVVVLLMGWMLRERRADINQTHEHYRELMIVVKEITEAMTRLSAMTANMGSALERINDTLEDKMRKK